jgi:hypothetical protein
MISKLLFSLALALEAGSWLSLTQASGDGQMLSAYLAFHAPACIVLAAAMWRVLPAHYRAPLPWSPLIFFSLAFFIPLLGMLGVLIALFPALYLPGTRDRTLPAWRALPMPTLPFKAQEALDMATFVDGGGLQEVLRHADDPDRRLQALLATRRMPVRDAIPILKLALADPSDDVRLLAYSMLDRQESQINLRIEQTLAQLTLTMPGAAGALHATLAEWYWELGYLGLAQGSVLAHVLGQATEHARHGIDSGEGSPLMLLAGRIALLQGDLGAAQRYLQQAAAAGMKAATLAPFEAELAFRGGRYEQIAGLLAGLGAEQLNRPPFAALARCWA